MNKSINYIFGLIGGLGLIIPLILVSCIPPSIFRAVFYIEILNVIKLLANIGLYAVLLFSVLLVLSGIKTLVKK
ncbi:hypothetical protein [Paenibacillus glycanilyticus]|uniref:hypothetical protein n=1 Tax=Paenibacillus glycanilyticus TaxID=126569 RepID=UPI00191058A4|nr:hypothetical protein [Paenibacillus glycanilyticus]